MEEAEQTDAVDRAGMTVFLGIQLLQPARQLIRAFASMHRSHRPPSVCDIPN
jgi:hypothetical protein